MLHNVPLKLSLKYFPNTFRFFVLSDFNLKIFASKTKPKRNGPLCVCMCVCVCECAFSVIFRLMIHWENNQQLDSGEINAALATFGLLRSNFRIQSLFPDKLQGWNSHTGSAWAFENKT